MTVMKILNQLPVLGRTHIARPNHFCSVNIGVIIDPLVKQDVVMRAVADDGELASRIPPELREDSGAAQIGGCG
jgi:hypothetical protein